MFLNCIKSYIKKFDTDDYYIAWDKKLLREKNFRHEACDYKGNRDKEKAKEVFENETILVEMLQSLGIKNLYPRVLEADDVIAWLSKTLDGYNIIVTTDGDMLQLVDEKTSCFQPQTKKFVGVDNFEREVGMNIKYFLAYKAIKGDGSDNIDGIDGYGKVRSKKLAIEYIDGTSKIDKAITEIIEKNITIMDLDYGYNVHEPKDKESYEEQLKELVTLQSDLDVFRKYCEQYNFKSYLKKFNEWESIFGESRLFSILNNMFG